MAYVVPFLLRILPSLVVVISHGLPGFLIQIPGKVSAWSNLVRYPPEFWWLRGRVDGVFPIYKADSSVEGGQVL